MHKSVHKSTVPDSYTLLFDVKSYYLNGFCSHVRYVGLCMHVCMYQEHLKKKNTFLVCLRVTGSTSPRSERDSKPQSTAREAGALPRRLKATAARVPLIEIRGVRFYMIQLLLAYDSYMRTHGK